MGQRTSTQIYSMKLKLLLSIVLIASCCEVAGQMSFTESPLRDEAVRIVILSPEEAYSEAQKMAPDRRKELIEYLGNEKRRDIDQNRWRYEGIQLGLGDEDMLKEYIRRSEFGTLRYIPNPHILELAAQEMFQDDHRWVLVDGVPRQPHTELALDCVSNILRIMPQVPAHAKNWVDTFNFTVVSRHEVQRIFCNWWIENADAWRRRDFAALKSGPDMSHRQYSKLTQAEQDRIQADDDPGRSRPPLPTPPPISVPKTNTEPGRQIPTIQKPATSEFTRKGTGMLLPAIILFGLGIGAWVIYNKRN